MRRRVKGLVGRLCRLSASRDAFDNAVVFDSGSTPVAGAEIYISYAPIYDCPEEKDTGT